MDRAAALVVPALKKHTATVIFAHGLGDKGDSWLGLAENWRRRGMFEEVAFIFPNALTIPIEANGRFKSQGWYDIKTFNELARTHDEPGIMKSRDYLNSLIQAESKKGIASSRIVLGGFSQGGAISLFTGLTYPDKLAGFFGLSSYLLMHDTIESLIPSDKPNKDTPIFMGHGDRDPMVRYQWGQMTAKILGELGYKVNFRTYKDMIHTVIPEEMDDLEKYIRERLPPISESTPTKA